MIASVSSWNVSCILGIFLLFGSCSSSNNESKEMVLHDKEALNFLGSALDANGSLDKWNDITELSFLKKTRMFLPDSSIEMKAFQKQTFRNFPSFYGEIEYLEDEKERRIIQNGDDVLYYEKGVQIKDSLAVAKAKTNIRTAYYVIGLPFKLNDDGPILKGVKDEDLADGRTMKSLNVVHKQENGNDKDEQWWVYFDPESNIMKGYLIEHDNRYSYILNDSLTTVNGFSFPLNRRSIAMDNKKENVYLRADYEYSDIEIQVK